LSTTYQQQQQQQIVYMPVDQSLFTVKLSYDQSQQRSGHANKPQNHKLITDVACGLVYSLLIGFFLATQ